jgi:hypothetical protein
MISRVTKSRTTHAIINIVTEAEGVGLVTQPFSLKPMWLDPDGRSLRAIEKELETKTIVLKKPPIHKLLTLRIDLEQYCRQQ